MPSERESSDRYQPCEECGDPVDTESPPLWKAPNDEQWWHDGCYSKLDEAEKLAAGVRGLMVEEGKDDGLSDEFHNRLDNAQAEIEEAVKRERLRQDQDLVTDGGTSDRYHEEVVEIDRRKVSTMLHQLTVTRERELLTEMGKEHLDTATDWLVEALEESGS